jgi:CBS domain-containing protein
MHQGARTVPPTATVVDIERIMKEVDIGLVPVVEDDRIVGMVTDRDLALRGIPNLQKNRGITARDVM